MGLSSLVAIDDLMQLTSMKISEGAATIIFQVLVSDTPSEC